MTSPLKKRTQYTLPLLQQRILSDELGKYVEKDEALVGSLEREKFVSGRQGDGYFTDGWGVNHLDRRSLSVPSLGSPGGAIGEILDGKELLTSIVPWDP